MYADFVGVYEVTSANPEHRVLDLIDLQAQCYGADHLEYAIVMATIYAGMIAEENKANTRLGRRIKRLGMHQILQLGVEPAIAANHSRNRPWRDIARECESYGF